VPVIGLARRDAAADGIGDDWYQTLAARVGWILQLHERDRVHARIGVAPVGLEPAQVGFDRLGEQPASRNGFTCLHCRFPAVLVNTAEDAVRFARRAVPRYYLEQYPFRLFASTRAVEPESELLLDQGSRGKGQGHLADQRDHVVPCPHRAVRQVQIDHYAGFRLRNAVLRQQLALDRPDRVRTLLARGSQTIFHAPRIVHAIAENIGLQPLDVGEALEQLKDGTVRGLVARGDQPLHERVAVVGGVGRLAIGAQAVRQRAQRTDIEREWASAQREHQHGAVRLD